MIVIRRAAILSFTPGGTYLPMDFLE